MKPTAENVIFLHTVAVEAFGGSEGIRDVDSLLAAVARSWGSSFGRGLFPTPFDKSAAITESVIRRYPFVDGNKRTAMYAAGYLLETFGYEADAEQQDLEDFAVNVAESTFEFAEMSLWFDKHTRKT